MWLLTEKLYSSLKNGLAAALLLALTPVWAQNPVIDLAHRDGFEATYPVQYPSDVVHSPLTADVIDGLTRYTDVLGVIRNDVFAKAGDTKLVSSRALACFGGDGFDLGAYAGLQGTLDHFLNEHAALSDSFSRVSLATGVGRNLSWLVGGNPSPLVQEFTTLWPRITLIAFGENDMAIPNNLDEYANNLLDAVDYVQQHGSVPLVYASVPCAECNAGPDVVLQYRNMARTVAQFRQVPFLDLYLALDPLPGDGLGADGINMNVYNPGTASPCVLTSPALSYGYNMFNLVSLQALDRLRSTVILGGPALDSAVERRTGKGDLGDPVTVDGFPFGDGQRLVAGGPDEVTAYDACAEPANTDGPEVIYRIDLAAPKTLHADLISVDGADLDLWLFEGGLDGSDCVTKVNQTLERVVGAGTWYLVVEAYNPGGGALYGEYLLSVDAY